MDGPSSVIATLDLGLAGPPTSIGLVRGTLPALPLCQAPSTPFTRTAPRVYHRSTLQFSLPNPDGTNTTNPPAGRRSHSPLARARYRRRRLALLIALSIH